MISEREIAKLYHERMPEIHDNYNNAYRDEEFDLGTFMGDRLAGVRHVRTYCKNPEILKVLDFESGRSLVIGIEGLGEEYNMHCLLLEKGKRDLHAEGYWFISPPPKKRQE